MNMRIEQATLDALRANALRFLAIDAVEQAGSGHPGMPMGMADIAVALWTRHLAHDPADPAWPDRDRFVLGNGHGSMLLYALLHLTGYDLPLDELRRFRQLHSKTPGHPEFGVTPGVETTTGPLGQGLANAVGMALAEKLLAREFNRPGHTIVDHRTWVFFGDGCLMEGVSHEAASFAGVQRLSKLIAFWDDNRISIDGDVAGWFADDTPARFRAYGWNVIERVDGHDIAAIDRAIGEALANADNDVGPTLICCRTTIGYGSPGRAGSADALLRRVQHNAASIATRKASQEAIGRIARALPELLGGSADLTHSNLTAWSDCGAVRADAAGRHIKWGVREISRFGDAAPAAELAAFFALTPERVADAARRLV